MEAPKQEQIYYRYVDDILRTVKVTDVRRLLDMANALHRNLEFTIEEEESSFPFLDMLIQRRRDNTLRSGWYTKPTDTGLMMDYLSLAPVKYKRNIVEGTVHRRNQATSDWDEFTAGIEKVEKIFEKMDIHLSSTVKSRGTQCQRLYKKKHSWTKLPHKNLILLRHDPR